jgi:hypothetical protein
MVLKLLLGVMIFVAAVLVVAATKSATFHIEKSSGAQIAIARKMSMA